MIEILGRLLVSLAVGLLIGLERGWRSRDAPEGGRAAGLRTLGLAGLLGGVLAVIGGASGVLLVGFGLLALALVLTVFQVLEARATGNASATGVVAGLLAFGFGALAVLGDPVLAIAGGVSTTVILAFKQPLHGGVRALSWPELRALLVLLVMTALVLPILPDRTLDPWAALNPRRIWLLAVLIAGVSFVGYFAMRLVGRRGGLMMAALAGGLASSTATTLSFARLVRQQPPLCGWLAAGTLFASGMMGLRVVVVAAAVDRSFAVQLLGPMAAFAAASFLAGGVLLTRRPADGVDDPGPQVGNPVELGAALKFAALIAVLMLLAKLSARWLGRWGVYGLAAVSGLADVDALTLSIAGMSAAELTRPAATLAVLIGVAANTLAKSVIAGLVGTLRHGLLVGIPGLAALLAATAVYAFIG
ncbi:MgtC/SapB family protein [Phenylobacterium sp.]|uniref:MgtC/SapB family protein n=1 Tax=Phenylobacterium sp. TaxID=1871053 RepID=UPI0035C7EBDE